MTNHLYWYKCDVSHGPEHGIYVAVILRPDQQEADRAFEALMQSHHLEREGELQTSVDPDPEGDARLRHLLQEAEQHSSKTATQYVACAS